MQDADNSDAIVRESKVDEVFPDDASAIAAADVAAVLRLSRRFCQGRKGRFQCLRVPHGLRHTPLPNSVVKDIVQIMLRGGTETIFSQAA